MKFLVVKIDKTHPYNFGDPAKDEYIKGAASACWKANKENIQKCEYAVAVYKGVVVSIYKIEDRIEGYNANRNLQKLLSNITYPPYRIHEIKAHACSSANEIRDTLKEYVSIFEEVVKVDINNPKKFEEWQNRFFLILKSCDIPSLNSLVGKRLPYKNINVPYGSHTYCCWEEE